MKLTIIYPDILKGASWSGYYYTGIGYLAAMAKKGGHEVSLIHVTHPPKQDQFMGTVAEEISSDKDALIGFSATTNMFSIVKLLTSWIKSSYKNLIIVGGVHPTLNPEETIRAEGIDAICVGEGEEPLLEFMDNLQNGEEISHIRNIWIKHNGKIYKNPLRPILKDLDTLPFPDRGIFDYKNLEHGKEGTGIFMASRGCPYDCYYCCNHAIKACIGGERGYLRFRSVDNVIREMKQTIQDLPFIRLIHFDDDILPIRRTWFKEFAVRYSREISLPFECNIRPNLINETTVELLRNAGCRTLRVGLESGNSFIRNKILNRSLSEETIIKASLLCKEAGIRLYTFNMVGLPFEDMSARLETIKLNARIDSDEEQVSIFYPYEKTRLYEICKEQGLLRKREVIDPFRDTSLSFGFIERNQILFIAYYFALLVRLYKFYFRLSASLSKIMIKWSDRFFSCRINALTLYPLLNPVLGVLIKHKRLEEWTRKIKHTIIKKDRVRRR